jgi:hypothetical protein
MTSSTDLLAEAREINQSLARSRSSLYSTVDQTETTAEILHTDGNILKKTLHHHKYELKTALESTKRRLQRIKASEKFEKWGITAACGVFLLVVMYIMLVRFRIFYIAFSMIFCFFSSSPSSSSSVPLMASVGNGEL